MESHIISPEQERRKKILLTTSIPYVSMWATLNLIKLWRLLYPHMKMAEHPCTSCVPLMYSPFDHFAMMDCHTQTHTRGHSMTSCDITSLWIMMSYCHLHQATTIHKSRHWQWKCFISQPWPLTYNPHHGTCPRYCTPVHLFGLYTPNGSAVRALTDTQVVVHNAGWWCTM